MALSHLNILNLLSKKKILNLKQHFDLFGLLYICLEKCILTSVCWQKRKDFPSRWIQGKDTLKRSDSEVMFVDYGSLLIDGLTLIAALIFLHEKMFIIYSQHARIFHHVFVYHACHTNCMLLQSFFANYFNLNPHMYSLTDYVFILLHCCFWCTTLNFFVTFNLFSQTTSLHFFFVVFQVRVN